MTVTGFPESIPLLNAYFMSSEQPMSGGYDMIWAAQDLDCGLLAEYQDSMVEPLADYEEDGDLDSYYAAVRDNWNGAHALPTWSVSVFMQPGSLEMGPWDASSSVPAVMVSLLEPAEEDGAQPYVVADQFGGEQQFIDAEIDDLDQGVVGTFGFAVMTGVDGDGNWLIDEIQLEVNAPACEF